jgi:acyl-CoA synthetase (NDP forming)
MIDLAQALLRARPLAGPRIAVVGDGGGHGAIACDVVAEAGLDLPILSNELAGELAASLPPTASTRNPVDLAGGGEQDFFSYARVARAVLASGEVDGVLLTGYFGGYSQYSDDFAAQEAEVARQVAEAARDTGRPLVAQTMYSGSPTAEVLRAGGVPVYPGIAAAVGALAALAPRPAAPGAPVMPPAQPPPGADGYFEARSLLEAAGIGFVAARSVARDDEVETAAADIGYPVVLKALGLLHKSDAGGVVVGIAGPDELGAAVADMRRRLDPPGYSVERMAPVADGIELIVGAGRDPRFGPVAAVGLGGIYTEIFGDVAVGLAPLDVAEAERMLFSLRGAPLLAGARGRRPCDVRAAAEAAGALSRVAAAHPSVTEIEINPLLVTPDGAVALDARVIENGVTDAG